MAGGGWVASAGGVVVVAGGWVASADCVAASVVESTSVSFTSAAFMFFSSQICCVNL